MSSELVCNCGRKLRVGEHHAGRRVQCPGCGASMIAPEAGAPAAVVSSIVIPPSRMRSVILLALFVSGLAGVAASAWWYLSRRAPKASSEVTELSLIPHDAQGFLRVRAAELWSAPVVRAALDKAIKSNPNNPDPIQRLDRLTGLTPEQVGRACFVLMDAEERLGWTVIKTVEPIDVRQVMVRIGEGGKGKEHAYERRAYYSGADPEGRPIAVSFLGPTLMVVGPEEGVKLCLTRLATPPPSSKAALTAALARYESDEHLVGGIDPVRLRGVLKRMPGLPQLDDVRSAMLTANVDKEATVELIGETGSEDRAMELEESAKTTLGASKLVLYPMLLERGEKGKAAGQLLKLVGRLKIGHEGGNVTASLKTDPDTVVSMMVLLPGLIGK